jgi:hypothetical protein
VLVAQFTMINDAARAILAAGREQAIDTTDVA